MRRQSNLHVILTAFLVVAVCATLLQVALTQDRASAASEVRVSGVVRDPSGVPVAGAYVGASAMGSDQADPWNPNGGWYDQSQTFTDSLGRYELWVNPGAIAINAAASLDSEASVFSGRNGNSNKCINSSGYCVGVMFSNVSVTSASTIDLSFDTPIVSHTYVVADSAGVPLDGPNDFVRVTLMNSDSSNTGGSVARKVTTLPDGSTRTDGLGYEFSGCNGVGVGGNCKLYGFDGWATTSNFSTWVYYDRYVPGHPRYQISSYGNPAGFGATNRSTEVRMPVATVRSVGTENGEVTVLAPDDTALSDVSAGRPVGLPAGTESPTGEIAYTVDTPAPGDGIDVQLELPAGSSPTAVFKRINGALVDVSGQVTIDGDTIILRLVDGGVGDEDGLVNGVIVDPIVPVRPLRPNALNSVSPSRVFDTRPGQGGLRTVSKSKVGGGYQLRVKVTDLSGVVPASGVGAVSMNVTVTEPDGAGYVTVYPCGTQPLASSLNYVAGQTIPNAVIAPVSAQGEVCFYSTQPTHVLADVNGWFSN